MATTNSYLITNTNSGAEIGEYRGATEAEALDAMARDQGYTDHAAMLDAIDSDGSDTVVAHTSIVVRVDPSTLGLDGEYPEAFARFAEERLAEIFPGADVTVEIGAGDDEMPVGDEGVMQDVWDAYCGLGRADYERLAAAIPEARRAGYLAPAQRQVQA